MSVLKKIVPIFSKTSSTTKMIGFSRSSGIQIERDPITLDPIEFTVNVEEITECKATDKVRIKLPNYSVVMNALFNQNQFEFFYMLNYKDSNLGWLNILTLKKEDPDVYVELSSSYFASYVNNRNSLRLRIEPFVTIKAASVSHEQEVCNISIAIDPDNTYLMLTGEAPTVSNFTVEGTSIDSAITGSFTMANASAWTVKAIKNGVVKAIKTGTSSNTSFTFNVGDLTEDGTYVFKVEVSDGVNTAEATKDVTLSQTAPIITSIEPSNILKNRTNPITISVTGENISTILVEVSQGGIVKHSSSSLTSTIAANVLNNGTATINVTATYQGIAYTKTTTRATNFTAYGKPQQPTLNVQPIYNTPKPVLGWRNNSEQVAYKCVIKEGDTDIVDTGAVTGTGSEYQYDQNLQSGHTYAIYLYIKNQYDLWSDPVSASFTVQYSSLSAPTFTLYSDSEHAKNVLVIASEQSTSFYYHEVYRRIKGTTQWQRISSNVAREQEVHDCECGAGIEYEYKVVAVSLLEAKTDSVIKSVKCDFHNTHISIANSSDSAVLDMDVSSNLTYTDDITFNVYAGQSKPDSTGGGITYATADLSCECEKDVFDKLMQYYKQPLLCVRDLSGIVLYGRITQPKVNFQACGLYNISFKFTECYNKEVDVNASDEPGYCYFIERTW